MSYLNEFLTQIQNHDYSSFLKLWEEYCSGDELDTEEVILILNAVKNSQIAPTFGKHVDRILPLWKTLSSGKEADDILRLIVDLYTNNSSEIGELAFAYLEKKFGGDPQFANKLRLAGIKNKDQMQGAISNYELLNHLQKGNFVFHTLGWGVGETLDVSFIREQASFEFDFAPGKKDLSFRTAFKTLIPLAKEHFLSQRFGSPDQLEQKAKKEPLAVIHMLLKDLGPKNASEIKDEICEVVIPEADWARWWQSARSKMKKDTMIDSPEDAKKPYRLRKSGIAHEEKLQKALDAKPEASLLIPMVYSFLKDFPETLKNDDFKKLLAAKVQEALSQELTDAQELQLHFFLQDLSGIKESKEIVQIIKNYPNIEQLLDQINIQAFKKRLLTEVRKQRHDAPKLFLELLLKVDQNLLRDYLLTELLAMKEQAVLKDTLAKLWMHPSDYPECFLWYFQKILDKDSLPLSDKEGKCRFFEAFFILLSCLENLPEKRELTKKMQALLSAGRYAIVRQIMKDADFETVKEFLLLATKCHSLTDHDIKILHSLAEVVHPAIAKTHSKHAEDEKDEVIWTTVEGYKKLKDRIHQIATVETVENAKEIEVARSHGDLRENSEFKFALEKRDRLQGEMKFLSEQLNKARSLTKDDILLSDGVQVGTQIEAKSASGKQISLTILGPWDADPEQNIFSYQSKFAKELTGLKQGDRFKMQGEEFTIQKISSAIA